MRYYFSMKTPQTKFAIYRDEEGVAQGYVMYEFSEMTFVIREWVVLTTEALLGLTRFIGSHAGSFEVFTYEAPTADVTAVPVAQLMTEPKYQAVVKPYMQARIVNLEALCQVLELDVPETVAFDVQDETAPWNGGRFELRGGTLERVVQTEAPQLSGSIQAFTQWLLGYKRLSSLLLTGELRTNTPEEFEPVDALLTPQHPVLADYF
ncbi:MAG: enhanced intracellular survival protein Eis [Weissella confusa]